MAHIHVSRGRLASDADLPQEEAVKLLRNAL